MCLCTYLLASQVQLAVKNSPTDIGEPGDTGLISGLGRVPGGGNGNPLQYSCLENPRDRGAWGVGVVGASVHGVAKGWTRHTDAHLHTSTPTHTYR